jgi:hypothetical protein
LDFQIQDYGFVDPNPDPKEKFTNPECHFKLPNSILNALCYIPQDFFDQAKHFLETRKTLQ